MPAQAASCTVLGKFNEDAVKQSAAELLRRLGGKADCAFAFVSQDYHEHLEDFSELVQLFGHVPQVFGCSGTGLVGSKVELEGESGFSLLMLYLPDTQIRPFTFTQAQIEESGGPAFWQMESGLEPGEIDAWIVLADPVSLSLESWLQDWNLAWPGIPCLGGLASSAKGSEGIFVFHNGQPVKGGGLAVALSGGITVRSVLSQGCRPIGEPLPITQTDRNIVLSLGSRPAFEALSAAISDLSEEERELAKGNLFAGLATSEYVDEFKYGDFLIRNIMAADPQSGAVAISAMPRVGQTLQYQLRDQKSALKDARNLLQREAARSEKPFGALVFACNGRGSHLFGEPHQDAKAIAAAFGDLPAAGFFCNGEIGPVGEKSYIHGYSLSVALLLDKAKE